jgi:hypothetical protein
VLAVSGVPEEPEHFYFGSVNGGVWETRDAGRTWQPIFDSQPIGSIGALAIAPSNARVIYVGSGEADMRSDISQGNGMYQVERWRQDVERTSASPIRSRSHASCTPERSRARLRRRARASVRAERGARSCSVRATAARAGSAFSAAIATAIPARSTSRSSPAIRA